jgi:hypothetical protein
MKKNLILLLVLAIAAIGKAQIVYSSSYSGQVALTKLHQSGYKYFVTNSLAGTINLYNINHSLWKTIAIPTQTLPINSITYLSENLFDNDNLIEFVVYTFSMSTPSPTAPTAFRSKVQVYKENGTLVFSRDSASVGYGIAGNSFSNLDGVFDDGTGAKLKLGIFTILGSGVTTPKYEIYSLPGTIPCITCNTQTTSGTGLAKEQLSSTGAPVFYPNPASDQIKINYSLPINTKKAFIRIQDAQGKVVDTYEVTSDFSDLLIPATYQNGLYLYTLEVDGNIIKTEKIIVSK